MKRPFTILLIPPDHKPARQLQLSLRDVRLLGAGLCSFVVIILGLVSYNLFLSHTLDQQQADFQQVEELKLANLNKDQEIKRLHEESLKTTEDLRRIRELELKISAILKVNPKVTPLSRGATGQTLSPADTLPTDTLANQLTVLEHYHSLLTKNRYSIDHTPSLLPVDAEITSPYGKRRNPFGVWSTEFHNGVDFAVSYGTPVHVTASGRVTFAGWDPVYGRRVDVDHGNGIITYYGHNSRLEVGVNARVEKGDVIAYSGNSGRSTGTHLHYGAFLNGQSVDPLSFTNYTKEQ